MDNYLIYDLFSGVGFCNQLFSLETGIYLSNILKRKLILLVRCPLCHWGGSSWNFGKFVDFFDQSLFEHILPYGYEIHYRSYPDSVLKIMLDTDNYELMDNPSRFSHIVFVDKELDTPERKSELDMFLRCRSKYIFDISKFTKPYLHVTKSNAARCFSNFYTTEDNYKIMSRICECLTNLNPYLEKLKTELDFKFQNTVSIHFRFGDRKHSSEYIDKHSIQKFDKCCQQIDKVISKKELYVMCDRRDSIFLKKLEEKYDIIYVSDIVSKVINLIRDHREIVEFLLEMAICAKSDHFIGYEGSTVSHYIHYQHHLKGSRGYDYTERSIFYNKPHSWIHHNVYGAGIGWKVFFPDNITGMLPKLITLTNDGYIKLTENLLISLRPLGLHTKLKIYCIGEKCFQFFKENYPENEVESVYTSYKNINEFVEYRSIQNKDLEGKNKWAQITSYKIHVINLELVKGNDVIFTDGDIVFYKNPIPYLLSNIGDNELLIQNDETENIKKMCSGFFLMKSNPNTIAITNLNKINMSNFPNDQQYLRRCKTKHKFLPLDLFPHGMHFRKYKPSDPYIVHFNYDVGPGKINRMKQFKVWYIDTIDDKIGSYSPNSSKLNEYITTRSIKVKQGYMTDNFEHYCKFDKEVRKLLTYRDCRSILQIGFLAGHSAEYFLNLSNMVNVTSIDIGGFQSVSCGNIFLQTEYPNRTELITCKSCMGLDNLAKAGKKYDLILIDGSFDYQDIKMDIEKCKLVSKKDTLLIINNVLEDPKLDKYWTKQFSACWREFIASGFLKKISQFDASAGRGVAFANYTF